jgi:HAD superfamily phosphatase
VLTAGLFLFLRIGNMASSTRLKITCVLFDMDGVLVDVSRSYRSAIARTAEKFTGRKISAVEIQSFKNRGGLNDDWELTAAIINAAGVNVEFASVVNEFQRLYRGQAWDGLITEETPLIDIETLKILSSAGIDTGIVTGRPNEEARWTINRFGWSEFFRVLIAREQQHDRPKPDGYPLEIALSTLDRQHERSQTIYVGDTVDDVRAAENAGIVPVGFVPPYLDEGAHGDLLRRHGAEIVITDYDVLRDLIGAARTG